MRPIHHAVGIHDPAELSRFYGEVLGMEEVARRELSPELSAAIFRRESSTEFYKFRRGRLEIEIFLDREMTPPGGYGHLCFSTDDREGLLERARRAGYPVTRIPRPEHDLVFLRDGSGNLFEIKDNMPEE